MPTCPWQLQGMQAEVPCRWLCIWRSTFWGGQDLIYWVSIMGLELLKRHNIGHHKLNIDAVAGTGQSILRYVLLVYPAIKYIAAHLQYQYGLGTESTCHKLSTTVRPQTTHGCHNLAFLNKTWGVLLTLTAVNFTKMVNRFCLLAQPQCVI